MMNCYTTLPQFKERIKGMRAVQWTGAVPIFLVGIMAAIYLLVMDFSMPILALGAFMFWLGLWVANPGRTDRFGKKAWKNYPRKGQTIQFCFYDDYFEVECPNCEEPLVIDDEVLAEGMIQCPNCEEKFSLDLADDTCTEDE